MAKQSDPSKENHEKKMSAVDFGAGYPMPPKFYGPAPEVTELAEEITLPQRYGKDFVTTLLQDPYTLFCYWEVTPETLQKHGKSASDDVELVLMVYPADAKPFALDVRGDIGSMYIPLEYGGGTYHVQLGLRSADGSFILLMKSNVVALPPVGVSDVVEGEEIPELYRELYEQYINAAKRDMKELPEGYGIDLRGLHPLSSDVLVRRGKH